MHPLFQHNDTNNLLVQQIKQGDERALQQFYTQAYPLFFRYACYITGEAFEAFSIVQEAVLRAWAMRDRMESMQHLYCFIKLQVRWRGYYFLKTGKKRQRRLISLEEEPLTETLLLYAWNNTQQDTAIAAPGQLQAVYSIINTLSPKSKAMLDMYFAGGATATHIARHFGCSVSKAAAEIRDAIQKIKQAVNPGRPVKHNSIHAPCRYAHLPESVQQVIRLRDEAGRSFNEIAATLKLPVLEVVKQYMDAKQLKTA